MFEVFSYFESVKDRPETFFNVMLKVAWGSLQEVLVELTGFDWVAPQLFVQVVFKPSAAKTEEPERNKNAKTKKRETALLANEFKKVFIENGL